MHNGAARWMIDGGFQIDVLMFDDPGPDRHLHPAPQQDACC